ncbi:MAG: acyl-ACP thioesterase domain-containing protein [Rectinemataceae bacterium]
MLEQAFESKYKVRGYDCGYGGPLKPLALANFFQEAAGDHAFALGIGMDEMFARGRTWMLSRLVIELEGCARMGDEVIVRTWPAGTDRIFAVRYLELLSADRHRLAGARYDYLVVNIEKRRPVRPEKVLDPDMRMDISPPYPDLVPGLQDIVGFGAKIPQGWNESFRLRICPRHIDNNGHANNGHLLDWLCDALPLKERASGAPTSIKVDFVSEVKESEELVAYWASDETRNAKLSILARGDEIVARAMTRWV